MFNESRFWRTMFRGGVGSRRLPQTLREAISGQSERLESFIVALTDRAEGYDYPSEVRFEISEQDISAYRRAADFFNLSNVDVLCLQHEFGIFSGPSGRHIVTLLRNLRMPVVTTLHTILHESTRNKSGRSTRSSGSPPA